MHLEDNDVISDEETESTSPSDESLEEVDSRENEETSSDEDEESNANAADDEDEAFSDVDEDKLPSPPENDDADRFVLTSDAIPMIEEADRKRNKEVRKYSRLDGYAKLTSERRVKQRNKVVAIICVVLAFVAIAGGIALWNVMNADYIGLGSSSVEKSVEFAPSDDDIKLLAEQGYDAEKLTDKAGSFAKKFLSLTASSIESESWYKGFEGMVDYDKAMKIPTENMLLLRNTSTWKKMFDNHPYYATELKSCDSITWDITYLDDQPIPYCDITVTIVRPELEFYTINSTALVFSEFQDTYRLTFDKGGNIIKVKHISSKVTDSDVDPSTTLLDESAAKAYAEQLVAAGNAQSIKDANDQREKEEAAAKEREKALEEQKKAEAEVEELRKKQEEEAKKEAENNANANAGSGNSSNTNNSTNTSSGSGVNTGGNSGSNGNAGNGNASGGNTPSAEPPATDANASNGGGEGA